MRHSFHTWSRRRAIARARTVLASLAVGALAVQVAVAEPAESPPTAPAEVAQAPETARPPKAISLYYAYAIRDHDVAGPFTANKDHPLLDGAILNVKWASSHPGPGKFDWALLDKKISQWTAGSAKKVVIAFAFYGQTPDPQSPVGDNSLTPPWVYAKGVPRITFSGGGVAKGRKVSVPKVWDPRFYPIYEEFVRGLAVKYNSDPRVAGYQLGFGHVGTLNAQPSLGGAAAFRAAGWTPTTWETHIRKIIDISRRHLGTKVLIVKTPAAFLRGVRFDDDFELTKRVVRYSAEQGMFVLFNALTPNPKPWRRSRVTDLVAYLGGLDLPAGFSIGFSDDWPLWVPPERATKCPGSTCGRDVKGFEQELRFVQEAWDRIGRKYPIFLVFLTPETDATNPNNRTAFRQDVYDAARRFLLQGTPR